MSFTKEEDNDWVTVKYDRAKFKMVGVGRDAFPEVPTFKSAPTKISAGVLKSLIDRTIFAITQKIEVHYQAQSLSSINQVRRWLRLTDTGSPTSKNTATNGASDTLDTLIPRKRWQN